MSTKPEIVEIETKLLKNNFGQVEGVPDNPRTINERAFDELKTSLTEDPEFLNHQPLLVFDNHGEYIVMGGNQRLRAAKTLNMKTVPCTIMPADTPIEVIKARIIKHNHGYGDNDWDKLANEWNAADLSDWGVDMPSYSEADYSSLDGNDDIDEKLAVLSNNSLKAIMIEYDPSDYQNAFELVKYWRGQGLHVGQFLIEKLAELPKVDE